MTPEKKHRRRRSPIWKLSKEQFNQIVMTSNTYAEILAKLNLSGTGNYVTLRARLQEDGLDCSFMQETRRAVWQSKAPTDEYSVEECFVINPPCNMTTIRRKIRQFNLLPNVCAECSCQPTWNGKPLVLHIDHINGNRADNRLENLRHLCPNCHSQTDTYMGRNKKK